MSKYRPTASSITERAGPDTDKTICGGSGRIAAIAIDRKPDDRQSDTAGENKLF